MDFAPELITIGQKAKDAARKLAYAGTAAKNKALLAMAEALLNHEQKILEANRKDVEAAIQKGTKKSLVNRLALTSEGIRQMSDALKEVVNLGDPVG
ncbi:MAG: gamma-glutamyl-phosphate reductase, partial [Desulfitobacterium hafniense]